VTLRVVLADDQALVRSGFELVINTADDMRVVGSVADGVELLEHLDRVDADIVLMDVQMPRLNGIDATIQVTARHPGTRVLVLSTFDDDDAVLGTLQAGASGYLLKDATPVELLAAVRTVAAGDTALGPTVARLLLEYVGRGRTHRSPDPARVPVRFAPLTERERDVLLAMTGGRSNREIADHLHLSETTIKTHVGQILAKLGLRDRTQAVVLAFREGFIESTGRTA